MEQDLVTASMNIQLLGEQKVMGLLPGFVTEMSAFLIRPGIYIFMVPL